jgi:putative Holliday junction resolvase
MPDTPETILAFDFGLRRIGIAVGQSVSGSASPAGVVTNRDSGPDTGAIARLIHEWQPERLVVGIPVREGGLASEMDGPVEKFIGLLGKFGLPVDAVDEHASSLEAEERLRQSRAAGERGRISKEAVDAMAAVIIAERYLSLRADDRISPS